MYQERSFYFYMENKVPERPRRFMIVINNPIEHGFTHEKIKKILKGLPSVNGKYFSINLGI